MVSPFNERPPLTLAQRSLSTCAGPRNTTPTRTPSRRQRAAKENNKVDYTWVDLPNDLKDLIVGLSSNNKKGAPPCWMLLA